MLWEVLEAQNMVFGVHRALIRYCLNMLNFLEREREREHSLGRRCNACLLCSALLCFYVALAFGLDSVEEFSLMKWVLLSHATYIVAAAVVVVVVVVVEQQERHVGLNMQRLYVRASGDHGCHVIS